MTGDELREAALDYAANSRMFGCAKRIKRRTTHKPGRTHRIGYRRASKPKEPIKAEDHMHLIDLVLRDYPAKDHDELRSHGYLRLIAVVEQLNWDGRKADGMDAYIKAAVRNGFADYYRNERKHKALSFEEDPKRQRRE